MLNTIRTYIAVSGLTLQTFVTMLRNTEIFPFEDRNEADVHEILGYIRDLSALPEPTEPLPIFSENGVYILNTLLRQALNRSA